MGVEGESGRTGNLQSQENQRRKARANISGWNNLQLDRACGMLSLAEGETAKKRAHQLENTFLPSRNSVFIWKSKINLFSIMNNKRQDITHSTVCGTFRKSYRKSEKDRF